MTSLSHSTYDIELKIRIWASWKYLIHLCIWNIYHSSYTINVKCVNLFLEIKEILTFLLIFKVGKRRSVPGVVTFPLGNHITRETQYQNSDMQDPTHCMFIFNIFVESNTEHLIILRHSLHFNLDAAFRWQR